jgi:hypothetical protein
MAKNKLLVDMFQMGLIILMVFFSVSLLSSGKEVSSKISEIEKQQYLNKNTVIVKYKLIHGSDTIYVDRKLDSILNSHEYDQFLNKNKK